MGLFSKILDKLGLHKKRRTEACSARSRGTQTGSCDARPGFEARTSPGCHCSTGAQAGRGCTQARDPGCECGPCRKTPG